MGHVGRFNEQKNHFFLLKIFYEVYKQDNNCVLVLIGDGNLKPKIEKEVANLGIEKQVHFLGLRDNIPELLQGFDLFLFPSLYEGLPVTVVEAQASGLKIVTSSTVTKEVNITGLVTYVNLDTPETEWANTVISNLDYDRKNTLNNIKEGGYDIHENAKNLQNFYLNENNNVRN
nr:glycosyltransferase [Jejuia pallidilutea]